MPRVIWNIGVTSYLTVHNINMVLHLYIPSWRERHYGFSPEDQPEGKTWRLIQGQIILRWAGSAHVSGAAVLLVRPLEASMGLAHESLHGPDLDYIRSMNPRFQWQSAPASPRARSRGWGRGERRVGYCGGGDFAMGLPPPVTFPPNFLLSLPTSYFILHSNVVSHPIISSIYLTNISLSFSS